MATQFVELGPQAAALVAYLQRHDKCVALYAMNEESGAVIYDKKLGTRNNGTVGGNPVLGKAMTNGFVGIDFDGTGDYVDFGQPAALNFDRTDSFTFLALVNFTSGVNGYNDLFVKMSAAGTGYAWYAPINTTTETYQQLVLTAASGGTSLSANDAGGAVITKGTPYLISVTYAGTSLKSGIIFYRNGASFAGDGSGAETLAASIITATPARAGSGETERPLNGDMSCLAVFNAVMSAREQRIFAHIAGFV